MCNYRCKYIVQHIYQFMIIRVVNINKNNSSVLLTIEMTVEVKFCNMQCV